MSQDSHVTLGKFGAVYGIKGWLKVHSFTEQPEAIFNYPAWFIQRNGQWQPVKVSEWRRHNKGWIAKLDGVDDREQAQAYTTIDIAVPSDDMPELPEGEFYWRDLIGMTVVTQQGYSLGAVTDMLETGANDVLVVKANANDAFGKQERLIPYLLDQVVLNINLTEKQISVDWDPGF